MSEKAREKEREREGEREIVGVAAPSAGSSTIRCRAFRFQHTHVLRAVACASCLRLSPCVRQRKGCRRKNPTCSCRCPPVRLSPGCGRYLGSNGATEVGAVLAMGIEFAQFINEVRRLPVDPYNTYAAAHQVCRAQEKRRLPFFLPCFSLRIFPPLSMERAAT